MENVKLEIEEQSELNFLLSQAAEFQQKTEIYNKALEDVQSNASDKMQEIQKKYNLDGFAFQYDPTTGELILEKPSDSEEE